MEITHKIRNTLERNDKLYNVCADEQNDIINLDYKGESYRVIIEKVE